MGRSSNLFFVLAVLVGLTVAIVVIVQLGGRGRTRARAGADARLAAAVMSPAAASAWLGMTLQPVTAVMRKQLKLPRAGVIIADVAAGGPAARAGVQAGDLLRRLGETTIRRPADVSQALREVDAGARLGVVVWRQGQLLTLQLAAAAPPVVAPRPPALLPEATVEMEVAWLGLDIVPLSPRELREADLGPAVKGMLVDDVADGRGVDAGIAAGDIILAINGRATGSIAEFKAATRDAAGALVDVLRRGRHLYVSIPPPGTTPAERRLQQQRLPLTKVNWDAPWPMQTWPLTAPRPAGWEQWARRVAPALGWQQWPGGAAPPPGFAPGGDLGGRPGVGAEDWRRGAITDWQRQATAEWQRRAAEDQRRAAEDQRRAVEDGRRRLEDWRQRLGWARSAAPPGVGAFAVGR